MTPVDTTTNDGVVEVYENALALLEDPTRWNKGTLYSYKDGIGTYCILGAVEWAYQGDNPTDISYPDDDLIIPLAETIAMLQYKSPAAARSNPRDTAISINDSSTKAYDRVKLVLRETIKRLRVTT